MTTTQPTQRTQPPDSCSAQVSPEDIFTPVPAPQLPPHLQERRSLYGWRFQLEGFCESQELEGLYEADSFLRTKAKEAGISHRLSILFCSPARRRKFALQGPATKVDEGKAELIVWLTRNFLHLRQRDVNPKSSLMVPVPEGVQAFALSAGVGDARWFPLCDD